jgi:hypothetical protein
VVKKKSPRSSSKKTYPTKSGNRSATPPSKRWSDKVTTDSTHPPAGLFKKNATTIAKTLEETKVSPKGLGQAMQMLSFYENRAGKNLPAERKKALESAKDIIRADEGKATKSGARKFLPTKSSSTKKASK